MSGSASATITLPTPITTADFTAQTLALMGAQTGVITDFNEGSNIRTTVEAAGGTVEQQATIAQALAFQAIIYAAWAAFQIYPLAATPGVGQVTFATSFSASPPPASQNVAIPAGTLVLAGVVQYVTTAAVILAAGATSVTAAAEAVTLGSVGNVPANSVSVLQTSLAYPLVVTNTLAIAGGLDAETPIQTLQRFTAKVLSLGLASPVSIANACIGVTCSTGEVVRYATVYETWLTQAAGSQQAGFNVYIDNGSGSASTALIAAVKTLLDGVQASLTALGQRPAGVPYSILPVVPVVSSVVVSASLLSPSLAATLIAAVTSAVQAYYASLNFGGTASQTGLVAAVANVLAGFASNLSVTLLDSTSTTQASIAANGTERVLLQNFTPNIA